MLNRRWLWLGATCLGFVLLGGPAGCSGEAGEDEPSSPGNNGIGIGNTGGVTDVGGEDTGEEPEPTELAIRAVRITPDEVFNDRLVRCEADAVTPGGAVPSVVYLWERTTTGDELGDGPALNLAGKGLQPGGGLTCRALATLDGQRVTRDTSAKIGNRIPLVDAVIVSPTEAHVGETVPISPSRRTATTTASRWAAPTTWAFALPGLFSF